MTGNGHVRFGGGPPQKYCPDEGQQLGGGLPNHAAPPVLIGAAFPLSTSADLRVWPVAVKRRPKITKRLAAKPLRRAGASR